MYALILTGALATAPQPAAAPAEWLTDYAAAREKAKASRKDLVIYFRADDRMDAVLRDPDLHDWLRPFVCLRLPVDYQYDGNRLLDHPALAAMGGRPGLVVVSLHEPKLATHNEVISAHPLVSSRYGWVPGYGPYEVATMLSLPRNATLSQRSMIYAISIHPERPRSVQGRPLRAFLNHARRHSTVQANAQRQHHADIIMAMGQLSAESGVGVGNGSEVVAESWGAVVGGETVLEAAYSCVDAWRHSPGHWGAVLRQHNYFGYDLAQGPNGTWYATGIFAD